MTEGELQAAVIECARLLGWRVAHFRTAETKKGWRTPVQGDGKGFPDLVLVHTRQPWLIFAELKSGTGELAAEQAVWLRNLSRVDDAVTKAVDDSMLRDYPYQQPPLLLVELWRPADWISGQIERVLRGEVPVPAD